jgi:hypothetical protein
MLFIAIGGLLAFGVAAAMILTIRRQRTDDDRLHAAPTLYPDPLPEEDASLEA